MVQLFVDKEIQTNTVHMPDMYLCHMAEHVLYMNRIHIHYLFTTIYVLREHHSAQCSDLKLEPDLENNPFLAFKKRIKINLI